MSNTEFTKLPICTASSQFQNQKLEQIALSEASAEAKAQAEAKVHAKECICDHLANGALINLGIQKEARSPQSICPGPNAAWFNRYYSLQEMVDHIYGRSESLISADRPHMYAKEIMMYVEYFEQQLDQCAYTKNEMATLDEFIFNLTTGIDYCIKEAQSGSSYGDENLDSISRVADEQKIILGHLITRYELAKKEAASTVTA